MYARWQIKSRARSRQSAGTRSSAGSARSIPRTAQSPGQSGIVRGILGMSDEVRKGFGAIRVRMRVRSDAPVGQLRELALYSPVYEMISRSVPCELVLETW